MSDRDEFIALAVELLNDADTDLNDVVYSSITSGIPNPLTGSNGNTESTDTIKAFFDRNIKIRENQAELQKSETYIIVAGQDLGVITPKNKDFVTDSEGTKWIVFEEEHDVYRAHYILKARLVNG